MFKKILTVLLVGLMICTQCSFVFAASPINMNAVSESDGYQYRFLVEGFQNSYTWNGNAIKPNIKVVQEKTEIIQNTEDESGNPTPTVEKKTLVNNKDYTLAYSNNYRVGTATIKIQGKGNYTGTITKTFKIVQNKVNVSLSKVTKNSARVTFSKMNNISKYQVILKNSSGKYIKSQTKTDTKASNKSIYVDFTGLSSGTKYQIEVRAYTKDNNQKEYATTIATTSFTTAYVVGKVTISSVKGGNEMAQVNWNAVSGATGYEVYRSTKSNTGFTKVTTVSNKTKSYTNYLLGVTTYYYRVRAYKKINGKIYYGPYSTVKSCQTKKATNTTYYLRVNTRTNVTTVYAKNFSGKYVAVKALTVSCGVSGKTKAILGTHYTQSKYRWKYMHENCYTQYATRITGHYLFHSVPYSKPQPNTLWYNSYNKLGNFASAGCVRLRVIDSKWIYDHCPLKTKTVIVYSQTDPLKKQTIAKINTKNKNRVWDPTDPDPKNPWKK